MSKAINIEEYIAKRVNCQIDWYEKKHVPARENIPSARLLKSYWPL